MSDPPPDVCEVCGEGPVEVVLYPVAVHFKGSGFYSTDYGRGGKKKDAAKDGGEKSEKIREERDEREKGREEGRRGVRSGPCAPSSSSPQRRWH